MMIVAVWAEDVAYICIAKESVGFQFNEDTKQWYPTRFNVENDKYTLSFKIKDYAPLGLLIEIGKGLRDQLPCLCEKEDEYGYIECSSVYYSFRMNKRNLRYIIWDKVGYVEGDGDRYGRPYIEIGTCSPLETSD